MPALSQSQQDEMVRLFDRYGDKTRVAREMNISRTTVKKYLHHLGFKGSLTAGRKTDIQPVELEGPKGDVVKRYILTSAQNNTKLHTRLWDNLVAYAEWLEAEIMVARFTYDKASYGKKAVKPGQEATEDDKGDAWWVPEVEEYACDHDPDKSRYRLAPGLQWCAEMNILPTAVKPLTGLENYTGRESAIFPHVQIAMQSIASSPTEPTKFNYTTGTVTMRNYIAKKEGQRASARHGYGALIVEVNSDGNWWCRQLEAEEDGTFYDIPPDIEPNLWTCVKVSGGRVMEGSVEAVNWGDVHSSEIDTEVRDINWGHGGIIDILQPRYQIMHDVQSFRSRSHHEMKKFGRMFQKFLDGEDSVEMEIAVTAELIKMADRDFCEMVVASSNHDRHIERWLDEADYRKDLLNAEFFLEAQLERVRAMKAGDDWDANEWSLLRAGVSPDVLFLKQDDSYVIAGIEMAMHGDEGPNGARGTTANLTKLGRPVNKGHDHTATIQHPVWSAGACQLRFSYMSGPSSHSVSHIVTFPGGTRTMITVWDGRWRA